MSFQNIKNQFNTKINANVGQSLTHEL